MLYHGGRTAPLERYFRICIRECSVWNPSIIASVMLHCGLAWIAMRFVAGGCRPGLFSVFFRPRTIPTPVGQILPAMPRYRDRQQVSADYDQASTPFKLMGNREVA